VVLLGNAVGNDRAVKVLLDPWHDAAGANVFFKHSHDVNDALKKPGGRSVRLLRSISGLSLRQAVNFRSYR